MEFGEDKILKISDTDDNLSDISFVAPHSVDKEQSPKEYQVDQLLEEIRKNVWGCDLILCLFITALNSYRSDRCLRPFPLCFINEEGKNFNALRQVCDSIPPLHVILAEPKKCPPEANKLLTWLIIEKGHPTLRRITFATVPFPDGFSSTLKPHFVFEVCYNDKCESAWQKRKADREIILAYHGSAVDNFYSILKVGLQQHFSLEKEVLFGNGIYLSSELSVSAHYAPFAQTWANSALGKKHSVIAVCEIINDMEKVKCRDTRNKRRALNQDSVGEIPEKYFVVTDSDMVRVKYLMVYRQKQAFSVKSYLTGHLFFTLLIIYIVSLIAIGMFKNSSYTRYIKRLSQLFFDWYA